MTDKQTLAQRMPINDGFIVLAPTPCIVAWDLPLRMIEKLCDPPYSLAERIEVRGDERLVFSWPVMIAGLEFHQFSLESSLYCNDFAEADGFYGNYDLPETMPATMDAVKAMLEQAFGREMQADGERRFECLYEDGRLFSFYLADQDGAQVKKLAISVRLDQYAAKVPFEQWRKIPQPLITSCLNNLPNLSIDQTLVFSKKLIDGTRGYRYRSSLVKYRPLCIDQAFAEQSLMWVDKQNQWLGISASTTEEEEVSRYAWIIPLAAIRAIHIQNYEQARGPELSQLWLYLTGRSKPINCLDIKEIHYFNTYADAIEQLTGCTVTIERDYSNC